MSGSVARGRAASGRRPAALLVPAAAVPLAAGAALLWAWAPPGGRVGVGLLLLGVGAALVGPRAARSSAGLRAGPATVRWVGRAALGLGVPAVLLGALSAGDRAHVDAGLPGAEGALLVVGFLLLLGASLLASDVRPAPPRLRAVAVPAATLLAAVALARVGVLAHAPERGGGEGRPLTLAWALLPIALGAVLLGLAALLERSHPRPAAAPPRRR